MRRLFKNTPKWLPLCKTQEKRILDLLARISRTAPEIEISQSIGEGFAVDYLEDPAWYVPLHVGAEGLCAEYDVATGEFLEADHLWVARQVKCLRMRSLEVYLTGWDYLDGQFRIIWRSPHFYRLTKDRIKGVCASCLSYDEDHPRHFDSRPTVEWEAPDTARGPEFGVSGFHTVKIADRVHRCMRILQFTGFPDEPSHPWLDDRYITEEGRTVLSRRYRTVDEYLKNAENRGGEAASSGQPSLTYNGIAFVRWFDRLTDVGLNLIISR